ncbi:MAG: DUF3137 domain-containing protein [Alphaproteobacteria bacterium]|nr:DUF3137 domain-containing protein [Alphaproteobacteria bacterium]MBV9372065.1 DUF3137 domain-containing protein [Alphaproteobacteria bacterium]MBV9901092.1 DUF3137 domain-containing protein [Alphaproteobacteria bacterium]
MIELTADCFDEVCGAPTVRAQLGSLDTSRAAAMRKFRLYVGAGLILGPLSVWLLLGYGFEAWAWVIGAAALLVPVFMAFGAVHAVGEALKVPVLETIAARAGLEYMEGDFSPPVYPLARKALFGSWLSSERFTDLFHGADAEGRGHAVYEACLQRRSGKHTQTVFSGQVYALQRRPGARGTVVIVPDRKIFNFFKPAKDLERVKFDDVEPDFERWFEVYASDPLEARQLLADPAFRRRLLDYRKAGATYAWFGPDDALLALAGKDRFEPGSMLRRRPGEDRVKAMLDDVCAALAVLREFKAKLG